MNAKYNIEHSNFAWTNWTSIWRLYSTFQF